MNLPEELPDKPEELIQLEQRRAEIRRQRRELAERLAPIEQELQRLARGNKDDLDELAQELADGKIATIGRENLPEQRDVLVNQLNVVRCAEQKAAERVAQARERHNNDLALAFKPVHTVVVDRIATALKELVEANEAEQQLFASMPGGIRLPRHSFPGVGTFGCHGDPCQRWFDHARRNGYLDEPEAETTKPPLRRVARRFRGSADAAPPAPIAALEAE